METQYQVLTRWRDHWNSEADRLDAEADAWEHHERLGPFLRRQAQTYRLMAWDAHARLYDHSSDRSAAA